MDKKTERDDTVVGDSFDAALTKDQFAKLMDKAHAAGIMSARHGTLPDYDGLVLSYSVHADNSSVTFTPLEGSLDLEGLDDFLNLPNLPPDPLPPDFVVGDPLAPAPKTPSLVVPPLNPEEAPWDAVAAERATSPSTSDEINKTGTGGGLESEGEAPLDEEPEEEEEGNGEPEEAPEPTPIHRGHRPDVPYSSRAVPKRPKGRR